MYSSISLVRSVSGLQDATRIADTNIKGKIMRADALIDAYLRQKYILPLPYHKLVTLTFSGTGSSSDTLDIVIGGVTYSVGIVENQTASATADLLRQELAGNTSVMFDSLGSGQEIILVSLADSVNEATSITQVTSVGGTAGGITATVSVITNRYPQLVEHLSAELASGYLLLDNFGLEEEGTARDGNIRVQQAKLLLKQIQGVDTLEESLRIVDEVTGVELPTKGYPEARSYVASSLPENDPTFGVNMKF